MYEITFQSVVDPIQMGAAGANGFIGALTAGRQQKRQFKYNKQLMEHQAALNMDAWMKQYEKQYEGQMNYIQDLRTYNSPTAQMDRLAQAGINPNFIAAGAINNTQEGMVNPSPSGSVAGSSSVGLSQYNPDLAGKYAQLRMAEASVEKMDTESDKNRAETGKIKATTQPEADKLFADTKLALAQEKLTNEQIEQVHANVAAIQQYTEESSARTEATLRNALVNELNQELKVIQFQWQQETDTKRLGYEQMEAQASQTNAAANYQSVQDLRKKYQRELEQADERIQNETNRLNHDFEKDGLDGLNKAIDRATSKINVLGVKADYTSISDLEDEIALMSAGAPYLNKYLDKVKDMTPSSLGLLESTMKKFQWLQNRIEQNDKFVMENRK